MNQWKWQDCCREACTLLNSLGMTSWYEERERLTSVESLLSLPLYKSCWHLCQQQHCFSSCLSAHHHTLTSRVRLEAPRLPVESQLYFHPSSACKIVSKFLHQLLFLEVHCLMLEQLDCQYQCHLQPMLGFLLVLKGHCSLQLSQLSLSMHH